MSSFWTFLIIIGVMAIKFIGEAANNKDADQPTAPTDEEKSDIEKRIQEILGEAEQKRVAPTRPAKPKPATRPVQPKAKVRPAHTSLEQITPEISMSSHRLNQSTPTHKVATNPKKVQASPAEVAGKSEFDAMIDDFTLEKAVIYSEILEPKFKQY